MKKLLLLILVAITATMSVSAFDYCQKSCLTKPVGFGANTTGGTGKAIKYITNESELSAALKAGNGIYIITKDITITKNISQGGSNFTLMALPGLTITCNGQENGTTASLYLKGSNIILRNLKFVGHAAWDQENGYI